MNRMQITADREPSFENRDGTMSIVTLTPDFREQHLARRLLRRLTDDGFDVVAAVPATFSLADMKRLYTGGATHARTGADRRVDFISQRLFTLGPSIVLVCISSQKDGQAKLAGIKGRSDFDLRSGIELRSLSMIADRAVSLIHCPDHADGARHELSERFDEAELTALERTAQPIDPDLFASLADARDVREETHPAELPLRLAMVALGVAHGTALLFERYAELYDLSKAAMRMVARCQPDGPVAQGWMQLTEAGPTFRAIARLYHDEVQARPESTRATNFLTVARLAERLCAPQSFNISRAIAFANALRTLGCPVSDLEEHRLSALAAFHGGGL